MSKVKIIGDAAVVTSTLKLEDIKLVKKHAPEALILKGGEKNEDIIFGLSAKDNIEGTINEFSITFGKETRDEHKLAVLTINCGEAPEAIKEWFYDKYGNTIMNLNTLEGKLPAVIEGIKAKKQGFMNSIEIQ